MRQKKVIQVFILLIVTTGLRAQVTEIDRLIKGELNMTFPGIYFKNNSVDYAVMPYTVDSCFKYIAIHIRDINSLVIWRDSSETEQLTTKRIKKLKTDLNKYTPSGKINILSMGKAQKISQRTIAKGADSVQIHYLLSLNSVFDVSGVIIPTNKKGWLKKPHTERPRLWCLNCWKRGRFTKEYRRLHVK
ncbi:MAG: hypothetical protein Q8M29_08245 [Bacteroidota bacterium]|nr:hypothetical protein [Bacteroidota bacterium]